MINMTQAQLEAANICLHSEEAYSIFCNLRERKVCYKLPENYRLLIKRRKKSSVIYLKQGTQSMKLSFGLFDLLCCMNISINFLKSYLEENSV